MPTIPTAEQTVKTQVPTVKEYNIPGAVPGAFGEAPAQALGGLGKSISGIGDVLNNLVDQQAKVKNASLENEFMLGLQDIMHNDKTATIRMDGKEIVVPDGIGDRQGYQTKGASLEFEERAAKLRDGVLKQMPLGGYRAELTARISKHYLSDRETAIKHEAMQIRKADTDTYDALSLNYIESVKANPFSLPIAIENLKKNHIDKMNRLGTPLIEAENETANDIAKAALNAGNTILQAGGTTEDTDALLNAPGIKENIPKEKFTEITSDLDVTYKKLANLKDWQIKQTQTQGAFDLAGLLTKKALTPEAVREFQQAGNIDPITAAIFEKVASKVELNIPTETELTKSDYFLRLMDETIKKNDDKGTMKAIQDATTAYGKGDLGFYQYAYFVQEMDKKFKSGKSGKPSEAMVKFNNAVKSVSNFALNFLGLGNEYADKMVNRVLDKVTTGKIDPAIAAQMVQKETILELHPDAVTYPEEGRTTLDKRGNIKLILPDGTLRDYKAKATESNSAAKPKKPEDKK